MKKKKKHHLNWIELKKKIKFGFGLKKDVHEHEWIN